MNPKNPADFEREIEEIRRRKHIVSFENTGAKLTPDNKIILPHAADADFNSERCYTDYLQWELEQIGPEKFAKQMNSTTKNLIHELLNLIGDDNCQSIVDDFFTKDEL